MTWIRQKLSNCFLLSQVAKAISLFLVLQSNYTSLLLSLKVLKQIPFSLWKGNSRNVFVDLFLSPNLCTDVVKEVVK